MFADTDNLINKVLEERTLRQVSRLAKQEEKSSEYDKIRKEDELENISRTYQVKVLMMFIILN